MAEEFTVTTVYPIGLRTGDLLTIQGCINDQFNMQAEIVSIGVGNRITIRQASWWNLIREHVRREWRKLGWYFQDAWSELCDDLKEV